MFYSRTERVIGLWLAVYVSDERESKLEGRAFVFVDAIAAIDPMPHAGHALLRMRDGSTKHVLHSPSYIVDLFKNASEKP